MHGSPAHTAGGPCSGVVEPWCGQADHCLRVPAGRNPGAHRTDSRISSNFARMPNGTVKSGKEVCDVAAFGQRAATFGVAFSDARRRACLPVTICTVDVHESYPSSATRTAREPTT